MEIKETMAPLREKGSLFLIDILFPIIVSDNPTKKLVHMIGIGKKKNTSTYSATGYLL